MNGIIFGAWIAFMYSLQSGNSYQACYQKSDASAPTCVALTTSGQRIDGLADDADYQAWVKVNGVDSAKVALHTEKKSPPLSPAVATGAS